MSAARLFHRFAVCLCLLANAAQPATAQPAVGLSTCANLEPGPVQTVTRVIDGETLVLDDGRELRLAGALAPRAIDVGARAGQWPPEVAAAAELGALVLGQSLQLAFGGERIDRYGRLQAHAFVRNAGERRWVQGHMLAQGLARAFAQAGDRDGSRTCVAALLAAEREARESGRGLWADAAYRIRDASRPAELARYRSTFQVVEGRVTRVAQVRGAIYLNFSRNWRSGFSVSLRLGDRQLLGAHHVDPSELTGRRVRVRGWIEQRRAPAIDLSAAGLLEVLDEPGHRAAADAPQPGTRRDRGRASVPASPENSPGPSSPGPEAKPPDLIEAGR